MKRSVDNFTFYTNIDELSLVQLVVVVVVVWPLSAGKKNYRLQWASGLKFTGVSQIYTEICEPFDFHM